jgi:hypothetical protein
VTSTVWTQREMALVRTYVEGSVLTDEFTRELIRVRVLRIDGDERPALVVEDFLDDVMYAINNHNEMDEHREPDQYDDNQLLEVITGYLRAWDEGTFEPDQQWF